MQKVKHKKPYPPPLTIEPLSPRHTHTFIILHGRGSNAEKFGRELLSSANLAARLPSVKFVFLTASKRRSTILKKTPIHQWFDNYSLEDPNQRTDLQIDGLSETAEFLRQIINKEAHVFDCTGETGYQKVILGGLSQGCAASTFALLGGQLGECGNARLGAFFGMSGWLPFEKQLNHMLCTHAIDNRDEEDFISDDDSYLLTNHMKQLNMQESEEESRNSDEYEEEDEDGSREDYDDDDANKDHEAEITFSDTENNPFTSNITEDQISFNSLQQEDIRRINSLDIMDAINLIRDILDLPPASIIAPKTNNRDEDRNETHQSTTTYPPLQTPIFLGHGSADLKVSVQLGEKMANFLSKKLKMDITWKAYEGFGHWYKTPDEIDDILEFLQQKVDLPIVDI